MSTRSWTVLLILTTVATTAAAAPLVLDRTAVLLIEGSQVASPADEAHPHGRLADDHEVLPILISATSADFLTKGCSSASRSA